MINKLKKNQAFLWILFGRVVQVLISVLSLKLLTHFLDKNQVGLFFIFTAILTYFGFALVSPLGHYCNRQFHSWRDQGVVLRRLAHYFLYVVVVCLFCVVVAFPFRASFARYFTYFEFSSFILLGVLSNTTVTAFIPYLNMLEKRGAFVLLTCLNLFFSLCCSLFFISTFSHTAINWFWGQFFAQIIFTVISFFVFKHYLQEKVFLPKPRDLTKEGLKKVWHFAHPIALSSFFLWFILDGYRYVLENRFGLSFVAEISVGFAIAQRVSYALESIIQQLFLPSFYKKCELGEKHKTKEALTDIVTAAHPFYFVSTIFVIFLAPFLIRLLADKSYQGAYLFVIAGAIFHLFRKYSALATLGSHALYQTKLLLAPHAYTAFFLLFSLIILPKDYANIIVPLVLVLSSFLLFLFLNHKIVTELSFSLFSLLKKVDFLMCIGGGSVLAIFLWPWASSLIVSLSAFLFFGGILAFYFYKKYVGKIEIK